MLSNGTSVVQALGGAKNLSLFNAVKYAGVVSITLLLLELFATLQDETRLIWPSRLSVMKIIFLVNRYSPLIDTTLAITIMFYTKDRKSRSLQWSIVAYVYLIGSFFSELILMGRTMALWGMKRAIVVLFVVMTIVMVPASLITIYYMLSATNSVDSSEVIGYLPSTGDRLAWVTHACITASETVVIGLTLLKRYLAWRADDYSYVLKSRVFATLYRDGMIFYIIILAISIANMIVLLRGRKEMSSVLQMPIRVVHSTLCTRVLLNLRKAAARSSGLAMDRFTKQTTIAFEDVYPTTSSAHITVG